jgi:plasmid stabilization system protein ParE
VRKVVLSRAAERDIERLYDFLVVKSERAAFEATQTIRTGLNSLDRFPERGPERRPGGWRELWIPFGASGYVARYRVTPTQVVILRVFHGRERRQR